MRIVSLFCKIDDFFLAHGNWQVPQCLPKPIASESRGHRRSLHPSEVMTVLIAFHQSNYPTFRHFYLTHVCLYGAAEFPNLVSYSRFVGLKKEVLILFKVYLSMPLGICSGVSFVDSTRVRVCNNKRISSHRVFAGRVERSKTSMGWFYEFKLHLLISVFRELKTQIQLEHTRHRSFENLQVHVFSAWVAYQLMENNPALNFSKSAIYLCFSKH